MLKTIWAVVREGKIELLEDVALPEGTRVLVTPISIDDEEQFWVGVSESALAEVWDNAEDDVYAELLQK